MNTTKYGGIIVAVALILFFFILGNLLLFGYYTPTTDKDSLILFKTIYFAFILILLGIVYIMNTDVLTGWPEHVFIIFSILVIAAGFSIAAGVLKKVHDEIQVFSPAEMTQLQAENKYYGQYVNSLSERANAIKANNRLLESNINELSQKINNRTPIIIETVIELPPEIIYIQDDTPVNNYDDDDEEEEEDD